MTSLVSKVILLMSAINLAQFTNLGKVRVSVLAIAVRSNTKLKVTSSLTEYLLKWV